MPFPGAASSLDDLGEAVLDAFVAGDLATLERFRLTEAEHNEVVWPELPAAQGPSPYPVDMAWQNSQLRNGRAIPRVRRLLGDLGWAAESAASGEESIAFDSVLCEGETQHFATFFVRTDCYTHLRVDGKVYRIQLFKDVLERNGGHKIFRYYDEDLERVQTDGGEADRSGPDGDDRVESGKGGEG